ncbi:MAG: DUF4380 domain-containing protein [Candidatus Promineifilaceae bacterium]
MTASGPCHAYESPFHGWSAAVLENDLIRLVAVPDIGGRIMAYDLGPYPFLFVDPDLAGKLFSAEENQGDGSLAAWKNYGGDKTWPAPQGWDNEQQWHGPPDPVLDTGRYTLDDLSAGSATASVQMTSPPDPRTGVQITRRFTIIRDSSRVAVDLSFTNVSDKTKCWSIWDVIQLRAERRDENGRRRYDPACTITVPINPQSRFPRGYNVMFGDENNPQWQVDEARGLFVGRYLWEIGKVGLDSTAGWIAFSQGSEGYAFVELFAVEGEGDYPDEGATVECWTVGAGQVANLDYAETDIYLMEAELLGPLLDIAPGQTINFSATWGVCRCPGLVVDVTDAGCTVQSLKAVAQGQYVRLTGKFGLFDRGESFLIWLDEDKEEVSRHSLGSVDPLAIVTLDSIVPIPAYGENLEIRIVSAADGRERRLAGASPVHA